MQDEDPGGSKADCRELSGTWRRDVESRSGGGRFMRRQRPTPCTCNVESESMPAADPLRRTNCDKPYEGSKMLCPLG